MKKFIQCLLVLFLCFIFFGREVIAFNDPLSRDNNIYGIGIVNLSDLEDASLLVNSTNGDWGYVTIVITKDQKDKNIWQPFFDEARKKHIIPILRVATKFDGVNWEKPNIEEIDSWINFFNSLNWVIENRYIIIGNEPNHSKEWGGKINPEEYGLYLKTFSERLKNANSDYFVLSAALDQSSNNSRISMDEKIFLERMFASIPNIFDYIDGLNSHSYPNPAFSGLETAIGRKSIKGYEWELDLLKSFGVTRNLPVFITETGWKRIKNNDDLIRARLVYAFENIWTKDPKVVAVTPFILNYPYDPFHEFSWKKDDRTYYPIYDQIKSMEKISGIPKQIIKGDIITNFLNPFGAPNNLRKGYFIARNSGQNIWDNLNIKIIDESDSNIKVVGISNTYLEPFKSKSIAYTLTFPENPGSYEIDLGLFVNDQKIDNIYKGSIISIPPIVETNNKVFEYFSLMNSKIVNFINLILSLGSGVLK